MGEPFYCVGMPSKGVGSRHGPNAAMKHSEGQSSEELSTSASHTEPDPDLHPAAVSRCLNLSPCGPPSTHSEHQNQMKACGSAAVANVLTSWN